jgi:hypothetical protein
MYRSGIVALGVAGVSLLGACGGGGGPVTPAPAAPQISSLTISPQFVFLAAGTTEQLSATATLTDGSTTPETPVWSSSSSSIADVSTGGIVSAHTAGTATITAQATGVTAVTTITVQPAFTTRTYQAGWLLILENTVGTDVVRIGMDLTLGGAVSELSLNGADVVAKAAFGSHLIAIGLYDANDTYDSTSDYGWAPIESCDVYRHGGPILAQLLTGDTIYIKSNTVESVPDNKGGGPTQAVLSDVVVERWVSPVPNHPYAFQERYKLTHSGNDRHAGAIDAVPSYEITAIQFDRMTYYTGANPGTAATPTILLGSQMPQWPQTSPERLWLSERWGAIVNAQGYGALGYNPQGFPYAGPAIANVDPTNQSLGFSIDTPFSFLPGTTVQFDTFLMLGNVATMQRETYDIKRRLGPFPDISAPMGNLDSPAAGSAVSGMVTVSGWAFDSESDTSVELYVDDALVASGSVNMNRPDINTAYPGSPPDTAYQFDLDTTRLTNGPHRIEVQAADAAGNVALLPHHIVTVKN